MIPTHAQNLYCLACYNKTTANKPLLFCYPGCRAVWDASTDYKEVVSDVSDVADVADVADWASFDIWIAVSLNCTESLFEAR
jgi:hypothetical protein